MKEGGGKDWQIPIYAIDGLKFSHGTNIELVSTIASALTMNWKGDDPIILNFNFSLTAGITADSREELVDYIKIAHALNAGTYEAKKPGKPPPSSMLIIGDYVAVKGMLKDVVAEILPPWGDASAESTAGSVNSLAPTKAVFSGNFVALPGWDGEKATQVVLTDDQRFSSSNIKTGFYKG